MAQGDPILVSLTGATFLLTAETGIIVESEDRTIDSKLREVFDASKGYTVGYVFYDFTAHYNWSGVINGTTGLALVAPGVAMTTANDLSVAAALSTLTSTFQQYNGVHKSTGGIYTQSVNIRHGGEDLRMISGTAIQRTGIT